MTEKEQIKAEIEGRIALAEKCANAACEKNLHNTLEANELLIRQYKSLLDVIDSISEEKPSEDLEEAAENLFETIEIQEHENIFEDTFKKIFIAGAEWQKEQDVRDMYMSDSRNFLKCYEQGKKDMKQQMMKDAVEGFIFQPEDYYPKELVAQYNGELKHGDKVRIIIVKED